MALLASYSFDAGTGSTIADTSNNGRDLALTANGTWVAGHTSNAVGVVDTTQAAASGTVSLAGLAACTVMGWMKIQNFPSFNSLLMIDDGAGNKRIRICIGGSQALHFQLNTDTDALWVFTNDAIVDTVPPIDWEHVAVVWDGLNAEIYLNGVPVVTGSDGSVGATATGTIVGASRLFVGGDQGIGDSSWDDIRIYDQALDQATITTLMNTPVPNSGVYFSNGAEAEGIYLWNGSALERTGLIMN